MPPKSRSRCSGNAAIVAVLKEHFKDPDELDYVTDISGELNSDTIAEWTDMLLEARKSMFPNSMVSQSTGTTMFKEVIEANGEEWNLGEEETSWAETTSKMFRAMLRHAQQAVINMRKHRTSAQ